MAGKRRRSEDAEQSEYAPAARRQRTQVLDSDDSASDSDATIPAPREEQDAMNMLRRPYQHQNEYAAGDSDGEGSETDSEGSLVLPGPVVHGEDVGYEGGSDKTGSEVDSEGELEVTDANRTVNLYARGLFMDENGIIRPIITRAEVGGEEIALQDRRILDARVRTTHHPMQSAHDHLRDENGLIPPLSPRLTPQRMEGTPPIPDLLLPETETVYPVFVPHDPGMETSPEPESDEGEPLVDESTLLRNWEYPEVVEAHEEFVRHWREFCARHERDEQGGPEEELEEEPSTPEQEADSDDDSDEYIPTASRTRTHKRKRVTFNVTIEISSDSSSEEQEPARKPRRKAAAKKQTSERNRSIKTDDGEGDDSSQSPEPKRLRPALKKAPKKKVVLSSSSSDDEPASKNGKRRRKTISDEDEYGEDSKPRSKKLKTTSRKEVRFTKSEDSESGNDDEEEAEGDLEDLNRLTIIEELRRGYVVVGGYDAQGNVLGPRQMAKSQVDTATIRRWEESQ